VHLVAGLVLSGCVSLPYQAIRPTPVPDESHEARRIEQAISEIQGKEFAQQGARPIGPEERLGGLEIQQVVQRLSRVTERPGLPYRAYLYTDDDPNAAALADGRIYLSTGMVHYLVRRGGRPDELAYIVGHELAHTVAQHLVKQTRRHNQQQLLMTAVTLGTMALTRGASANVQQAGQWALDAAGVLEDVANSGYSQEHEFEADQLGIRYVIRAGYNPQATLDLLSDFARFENPWPFFRTHPYMAQRRAHLVHYLIDTGQLAVPPPVTVSASGDDDTPAERQAAYVHHLRVVQQLYPVGSISWQNVQRQLDVLAPSSK
jgi:predicted Zn-dependent protease